MRLPRSIERARHGTPIWGRGVVAGLCAIVLAASAWWISKDGHWDNGSECGGLIALAVELLPWTAKELITYGGFPVAEVQFDDDGRPYIVQDASDLNLAEPSLQVLLVDSIDREGLWALTSETHLVSLVALQGARGSSTSSEAIDVSAALAFVAAAVPGFEGAAEGEIVRTRVLWGGVALNLVTAVAAIGAAVAVPWWLRPVMERIVRRTEWRRARGQCIECGYPVEGLAICPECGASTIAKMTPTGPGPVGGVSH